ncbi:hypothetical protein BGZ72_009949 [Mortierella alpina]|nr:hypothetical protein BGZ72_009949 [Mortierella alpina]
MLSSLRKRRATKLEPAPAPTSLSLQAESAGQESQGSHAQDHVQDRDQGHEEALFAGMELDNWKWNDRERRTASVSPTKRARLKYEPAHYVDFDPGSPSDYWRQRSPSQSPTPTPSPSQSQSQSQSISQSPHPPASPTRPLTPATGEQDEGQAVFEAFEANSSALSEFDSSEDDDEETTGIPSDQDTDSSEDDQRSKGRASEPRSNSTVDDERDDERSEDGTSSHESDGDAEDLSFELVSEELQDTHGSVVEEQDEQDHHEAQEEQEEQGEHEEQENLENGGTDSEEDSDSEFWGEAGAGTKHLQEIKAKLEDLILRQTYIGTVAPSRREVQSMPMPLYLSNKTYPHAVKRTLAEEIRRKRYVGSSERKNQQRERRLARLEEHRKKGETQDQRIRYSSQCTSCIIQGLECSGHKPICSQCHQSSSATTAALSSKTAVPSSIRVLPSDTTPGFCSYPVEGDLIIAPDMYKRLKEAIPKVAKSTTKDGGMDRSQIANVIPNVTGRRADSMDAGWIVGITKKQASLYPSRPQLDKNPAANADYMLDIKFKTQPPPETSNSYSEAPDGVKGQADPRRRRTTWNISQQLSESQPSTETPAETHHPRNRSRLARTLDRRLLALPRQGSRAGARKDKADAWVVHETNGANGNKNQEVGLVDEDGDDRVTEDNAGNVRPKRRHISRYNPGQNNEELFRHLNPRNLVGDTALYRLAESLDDDHTVYLGLDKTAQDAHFANRRRKNMDAMAKNFQRATNASIRQLGWAGSELREGKVYRNSRTEHPRVEVGMDGVKTYRKIKTFKTHKSWTTDAAKVRKVNSKTFRPWVPEKGEQILPSVCDVPETSFLQALHHYASYFYTHAYPCPDVFEALDLPSHIALGMIIQEVISDFAFKLGKESQLEDLEVLDERLTAEKIFGKIDQAAEAANGGGISAEPGDQDRDGEEQQEVEEVGEQEEAEVEAEEQEEMEAEEEEEEEEEVAAAGDGAMTGYRFKPRPTFAFDSSEDEVEEAA